MAQAALIMIDVGLMEPPGWCITNRAHDAVSLLHRASLFETPPMTSSVIRPSWISITRNLHPAVALCALLFLLGFAFQGTRPLYDADEGRYTSVALAMLDSGDFIVPRLDPYHPHYAKPPLTYWALAASFRAFGTNVWAARVPGALAYVGVGLLIAWMARRLQLQNPWRAGTIWAITLAPLLGSNIVTTDMLLTLFETLAVSGFI